MQNLILNRSAPISNPKNKKRKSSYALLELPFFILRPIQLNKGFSLFSGPFWTVGKFLPSRSEAEQLAASDKKNVLINFVPMVHSFYIRTKFTLKYRVTTVHPLQCKTNFFIHLCF